VLAQRTREQVEVEPPGPVPFSLSIGAASVDVAEQPPLERLLAEADQEMYRDKARPAGTRTE